jgi:hypothetical protein
MNIVPFNSHFQPFVQLYYNDIQKKPFVLQEKQTCLWGVRTPEVFLNIWILFKKCWMNYDNNDIDDDKTNNLHILFNAIFD